MSSRVKILLAAGGVLVLLLLALYLKQNDPSTVGTTNPVQSIEQVLEDKTLRTKTEAYAAVANEKEAFYNRPASAFKQTVETLPQTVPKHPAPAAQVEATKAQNKQFDEAYEQIAQDARSIYEKTPRATQTPVPQQNIAQTPPSQTADERRRNAMLQDWGMNSPGNKAPEGGVQSTMFRAVIHGTQLVKVGQTALFRTKEQICYGNLVVPANTLLSGQAMISQNRLTIKINSVRINNEIFALPLEVYGSDGIPGIPLNYDQVGQIANAQASSTTMQEVNSAASRYGGTLGRVAGSLMSGVSGQVRSAKSVEVKLIDNQSLILKIVQQ